ncbi:MAG: STAS domain-containing protein [Planctomycetota bacterium]|jgi:anti-sigma B factor antagonist
MEFDQRVEAGVLVAKVLVPEINTFRCDEFREDLERFVARHARIVLDLSAVEFIDSAGLAAIITVRNSLRHGGRLALCGVCEEITTTIRLIRLHNILKMFRSRQEAVDALSGAA